MTVEPLVYTIPELAKAIKVSSRTAYELVGSGEIPSVQFSRVRLVPRKAVEKWLDELAAKGLPENGALGKAHSVLAVAAVSGRARRSPGAAVLREVADG